MVRIRGTNFCLTLFSPTAALCTALSTLVERGLCRYVVFQLETCPETLRLHYQVYLQTIKRVGYKKVQDYVEVPNCHVEQRIGTHDEADVYCKKLESRFLGPCPEGMERSGCFGDPVRGQGQRTDLDALKVSVDAGLSEVELWDEHWGVMLRNYRAVAHYKRVRIPKRRTMTQAIVFFGTTGTGKSFRANKEWPDSFHLRRPNDGNLWWDGYEGQETIIIEEFEGWIPLILFKTLIDEHPCQVAIKNASVEFSPKRIVFLSNKDPREWWPKACPGSLPGPVIRRLTAPIGAVHRALRKQLACGDADCSDLLCGTEPVDISVPYPVIHVE